MFQFYFVKKRRYEQEKIFLAKAFSIFKKRYAYQAMFAGIFYLLVLQPLRWCCVDCVIHHERDVREEQHHTYVWREQAIIEWSWHVNSIVACCHSAKLCAYAARDFRSQHWYAGNVTAAIIHLSNNHFALHHVSFTKTARGTDSKWRFCERQAQRVLGRFLWYLSELTCAM